MEIWAKSVVPVSLIGLTTFLLSRKINKLQAEPYMDEEFHVPQCLQYCKGNFSHWDPMITTLPGLYFISIGLKGILGLLWNQEPHVLCDLAFLRSVNILFLFGIYYTTYAVYRKLHPKEEKIKALAVSTTIVTFPVLYFFTFLYYTDLGSVFFVLLMYFFHLHKATYLSALMGIVSILFRQTNIVWVFFMFLLSVNDEILLWSKRNEEKKDTNNDFIVFCHVFYFKILHEPLAVGKLVLSIFKACKWYILLGLGFIVFIFVNNGIVVGDRTHHVVCLNFPQFFYFLGFVLFFSFPYMCSKKSLVLFMNFVQKKKFLSFLLLSLFLFLVHNFTHVHKYLLSDNRHYTFYVWLKIYKRNEYIKYFLVPVYFYACIQFHQNLVAKGVIWKIILYLCVLLATVPQKLLEFRYFLLPFFIFRLNMPFKLWVSLLHEFSIFVLVNIVTIYLFCEKPFLWQNSDKLQRFMW